MKQILLVAQREFLSQVKNKTFIIMTILSPIILVAIFGIIFWMATANSGQKNIAVVDQSGLFITSFVSNENVIYNFYGSKDIQGIKDTLLESKSTDALLVLPALVDDDFEKFGNQIELTTKGNTGPGFKSGLENKINKRVEEIKMEKAGISEQALKSISSDITIKTFNLKGGSEEKAEYIKFAIAFGLAYIIFMFIMIYGVKVMRSVVEEKNNRVVEIIISSVKPFNLMMGKIMGTTFVALTQFIIWIIMGLVLMFGGSALLASKMKTAMPNTAQAEEILAQNPTWMLKFNDSLDTMMHMNYPFILIFFVIYFLLGYLFYSSIFAAIGSAVENDTDTQQFTFYPIFPMMIALYGSMSTIENPDGPVSFWLSIFPLTSPISMVTRLPFGVEWWELLLSISILVLSLLAMVFFASKIYRVGILMYGKKPSLKEMWKWMRYSN